MRPLEHTMSPALVVALVWFTGACAGDAEPQPPEPLSAVPVTLAEIEQPSLLLYVGAAGSSGFDDDTRALGLITWPHRRERDLAPTVIDRVPLLGASTIESIYRANAFLSDERRCPDVTDLSGGALDVWSLDLEQSGGVVERLTVDGYVIGPPPEPVARCAFPFLEAEGSYQAPPAGQEVSLRLDVGQAQAELRYISPRLPFESAEPLALTPGAWFTLPLPPGALLEDEPLSADDPAFTLRYAQGARIDGLVLFATDASREDAPTGTPPGRTPVGSMVIEQDQDRVALRLPEASYFAELDADLDVVWTLEILLSWRPLITRCPEEMTCDVVWQGVSASIPVRVTLP